MAVGTIHKWVIRDVWIHCHRRPNQADLRVSVTVADKTAARADVSYQRSWCAIENVNHPLARRRCPAAHWKSQTFCVAKLNHACRDSQLNNTFGPAFAPSIVNSRHEIAEGQRLSLGMGVHLQGLINFHNTIFASSLLSASRIEFPPSLSAQLFPSLGNKIKHHRFRASQGNRQ
jgi:hypothetical protein